MTTSVPFEDLGDSDLQVDRVYQGGSRYKGSVQCADIRLVVPYTSGEEADWPDEIDPFTGTVTYFGDKQEAR